MSGQDCFCCEHTQVELTEHPRLPSPAEEQGFLKGAEANVDTQHAAAESAASEYAKHDRLKCLAIVSFQTATSKQLRGVFFGLDILEAALLKHCRGEAG